MPDSFPYMVGTALFLYNIMEFLGVNLDRRALAFGPLP